MCACMHMCMCVVCCVCRYACGVCAWVCAHVWVTLWAESVLFLIVHRKYSKSSCSILPRSSVPQPVLIPTPYHMPDSWNGPTSQALPTLAPSKLTSFLGTASCPLFLATSVLFFLSPLTNHFQKHGELCLNWETCVILVEHILPSLFLWFYHPSFCVSWAAVHPWDHELVEATGGAPLSNWDIWGGDTRPQENNQFYSNIDL